MLLPSSEILFYDVPLFISYQGYSNASLRNFGLTHSPLSNAYYYDLMKTLTTNDLVHLHYSILLPTPYVTIHVILLMRFTTFPTILDYFNS